MNPSRRGLLKILGPGLLMAGAAIGVSHLVQSTRAGAGFGYQLLIIVLLANLFKYPFFEYGHRYAVATGENLLQGYLRLGQGFLYVFLALNGVTAVISIAGVTLVTAALAQNVFPNIGFGDHSLAVWSTVLMGICTAILLLGHYKWLDILIKIIIALLFVATLVAFIAAFIHGPVASADFKAPSAWSFSNLAFIIALMGWMPAPIELSVWQSLWIHAKERQTGIKMNLSEAKYDFNFGYLLTVFLAIVFLSLGAFVMHGSGVEFSNSSVTFAAQVIDLYTDTIGDWSRPVIALAAFTAMFSTMLTLIDAYPRSLAVGVQLAFPSLGIKDRFMHWIWIGLGCMSGLFIISQLQDNLKTLVDLATTIAFLAAPVFAFINYRLIFSKNTPQTLQPKRALRLLSWAGMLYLIAFGILFLGRSFFPL